MKERPILFNADMVNAILSGRKTQTRRVIKDQPPEGCGLVDVGVYAPIVIDRKGEQQPGPDVFGAFSEDGDWGFKCPYGQPGDRLWVREATSEDCTGSVSFARYKADGSMVRENGNCLSTWWYSRPSCPSIHMPRWASRITLEIVSVRVERLLSISDEDAIAEGCYTDDEYSDMAGGADVWPCQICDGYQVHEHGSLAGASEVDCHSCNSPKKRFSQLWQSINGFDSWDANPWVWVVEFRRVDP